MIPKTVNVLGKRWKIVLDKTKLDKADFGECNFIKKTLFIDDKLPKDEIIQSIFHEIVHSISYQSGIRFSGALDSNMEEVLCESIANFMVQNKSAIIKILNHK